MNRPLLVRQDGFNMIEVLVTLVILLFGLLGLAGLMTQSQRAELESYQRAQAVVFLQDMIGRIGANRSVAACYAVSDESTGVPALGTSAGTIPSCGAGTVQAFTRANADLAEWSDMLEGVAELQAGNRVGAMIGARGCISVNGSGVYLVSVAWQGLGNSAAPNSGLNCGKDLYGDEAQRRVVSATLTIANLN